MAARRRLWFASTSSDDDREDLVGPAENDGVVALGHRRTPLAQLLQLAVEATGQQTDQRADHEDAAEREHEPQDCLTPQNVGRHPEAEGTDEGVPEQFQYFYRLVTAALDNNFKGRRYRHDE